MEKKYKHIIIYQNNAHVFRVENIKHGDDLGEIYYEPTWKQFVFSPSSSVIFSVSCMLDIIDFIENEIKL